VKGIESNPDKMKAIMHMKPLQLRKEVQKLINRIVALNRFMSKLAEWSLPFFVVLRGSNNFECGLEQQKAFVYIVATRQDFQCILSNITKYRKTSSMFVYI
jgi:hypothetical protein